MVQKKKKNKKYSFYSDTGFVDSVDTTSLMSEYYQCSVNAFHIKHRLTDEISGFFDDFGGHYVFKGFELTDGGRVLLLSVVTPFNPTGSVDFVSGDFVSCFCDVFGVVCDGVVCDFCFNPLTDDIGDGGVFGNVFVVKFRVVE